MVKRATPRPPSGKRRKPAVKPSNAKNFDWLGRPIRSLPKKKG